MVYEDALDLLNKNVLKKGCKVKMSSIDGLENFTKIDAAFVKKARPGELEDDGVVVIINGHMYDSAWIDEVES